jgi:hypothetical protein
MSSSRNATTLGVHLPFDVIDLIEKRAKANAMTKSKFAAQVILAWYEKKAPALSPTDSTARALVIDQENYQRSVQNNPQLMSKMARGAQESGKKMRPREVSALDNTPQPAASVFAEKPISLSDDQIEANKRASQAKKAARKAS